MKYMKQLFLVIYIQAAQDGDAWEKERKNELHIHFIQFLDTFQTTVKEGGVQAALGGLTEMWKHKRNFAGQNSKGPKTEWLLWGCKFNRDAINWARLADIGVAVQSCLRDLNEKFSHSFRVDLSQMFTPYEILPKLCHVLQQETKAKYSHLDKESKPGGVKRISKQRDCLSEKKLNTASLASFTMSII